MPAITSSTLALTPIRATARAPTVPALARTAEAIRGYWITKVMQPAHATVIGSIAVIAVRASAKPSTQPVTAIPMEAGRNIPAVSTGAKPIAGTAAIRITNMPATA